MDWNTQGFNKIKIFFEGAVKSGYLNHAYLFTGQEMIGKRTFAGELAVYLAGAGTADLNNIFIGPAESDSGKTIGIEEIRGIKNLFNLSSYGGGRKVAVINDAHLMTVEAQNALLKILEEPSESSIFILISANPSQLLPTVISRCQEIRFPAHSSEIVGKYLSFSNISAVQAEFMIKLSNGRIGLVKNAIENKDAAQIKGAVEELAKLTSGDINSRIATAQKIAEDSELQKKILYWILYLRTKKMETKTSKILRGLLLLYYKSTQPQLNLRLALESFLISI